MYCPHCGHPLLDDNTIYCTNCGKQARLANTIPQNFTNPPWQKYSAGYSSYQGKEGLDDLKNAFLLYLIGAIAGLIPVVGEIGGIAEFVGLIFLILGWRSLVRSNFQDAQDYKSTGKWLILGIIFAIVIIFVGSIALVIVVISVTPSTGSPPLFGLDITELVVGFVVVIALGFSVSIGAWIKMCFSMQRLSKEIGDTRMKTAGMLYIIQFVVGVVGGVGLVLAFFLVRASITSFNPQFLNPFLGIYSYLALGGLGYLAVGILIGTAVVGIIGSYFAFASLNAYIPEFRSYSVSPPP